MLNYERAAVIVIAAAAGPLAVAIVVEANGCARMHRNGSSRTRRRTTVSLLVEGFAGLLLNVDSSPDTGPETARQR